MTPINTKDLSSDWKVSIDKRDKVLTLTHPECTLHVHLPPNHKSAKSYGYSGTTEYKYEGMTYTFDRTGVEPSFYFGTRYSSKDKRLSEVVQEQLDRVRAKIAAIKSSGGYVNVPGTGFQITQKRKEELCANLLSRGTIQLTPSGFGTGYTFTTKKYRYFEPATAEQKKFFGVQTLYVEMMDCD